MKIKMFLTRNVDCILLNNGVPHRGGPFEATLEWLALNRFTFLGVRHPLENRQPARTEIFESQNFMAEVYSKRIIRPNFPPFTYIFDLFTTPLKFSPMAWIAFNPLSAVMAIFLRKLLGGIIIRWSVDFVPVKSENRIVQNIYSAIDKFSHNNVDEHWEVSSAALAERSKLSSQGNPKIHKVVPMGIWGEAFAPPNANRFANRTVVYFGNVNKRNGILKLLHLIELAHQRQLDLKFTIIGGGSLSNVVEEFAQDVRFREILTYHGFIEETEKIYKILASSSVAIAPFEDDPESFTAFADPSKLKAYLAASLPIILSDEPPNALELSLKAGATLVDSSAPAEQYLQALITNLESIDSYLDSSNKAYGYSKQFLWSTILDENLLPLLSQG